MWLFFYVFSFVKHILLFRKSRRRGGNNFPYHFESLSYLFRESDFGKRLNLECYFFSSLSLLILFLSLKFTLSLFFFLIKQTTDDISMLKMFAVQQCTDIYVCTSYVFVHKGHTTYFYPTVIVVSRKPIVSVDGFVTLYLSCMMYWSNAEILYRVFLKLSVPLLSFT